MSEIRVLHMEDSASDRLLAAASLEHCDYARFSVTHVLRLQQGLAHLANGTYEAILLDLGLPDSQGEATFVRVHAAAPDTPILILTGRDDDALGAKLVKAGAQDYLPKSELGGGMLARAIRYAIERKDMQLALRQLALHDPLTGLPNRTLFAERAQPLLALREGGGRLALAYIDLDGFKAVNDSFGHDCGDELLKAVAVRLTGLLRPSDTLARFGGDEFVVLTPQIRDRLDAAQIARKLLAALSQRFAIGRRILTVSASIGVALFPEHGRDLASLLAAADAAMYRSKQSGGNDYALEDTTVNPHPKCAGAARDC